MNYSQIVNAISNANLSGQELRNLNSFVVELSKQNRRAQAASIKAQIQVGDEVTVDHPKLAGQVGTITSIRRSKADVRFDRGNYTVPISLIRAEGVIA